MIGGILISIRCGSTRFREKTMPIPLLDLQLLSVVFTLLFQVTAKNDEVIHILVVIFPLRFQTTTKMHLPYQRNGIGSTNPLIKPTCSISGSNPKPSNHCWNALSLSVIRTRTRETTGRIGHYNPTQPNSTRDSIRF